MLMTLKTRFKSLFLSLSSCASSSLSLANFFFCSFSCVDFLVLGLSWRLCHRLLRQTHVTVLLLLTSSVLSCFHFPSRAISFRYFDVDTKSVDEHALVILSAFVLFFLASVEFSFILFSLAFFFFL
jgi:hypothetical protein